MTAIKIGKARLEMHVDGCIDCGTLWSSGWYPAKQIEIKVNKTSYPFTIFRCEDCLKNHPSQIMLGATK